MKMDRIYKIYRMRRKKINPVNLVNPVHFRTSFRRVYGSVPRAVASALQVKPRSLPLAVLIRGAAWIERLFCERDANEVFYGLDCGPPQVGPHFLQFNQQAQG